MFPLFTLYSYLSGLVLRRGLLSYFFPGCSDTPATQVICKAESRLMLGSPDWDVAFDLHIAPDRRETDSKPSESASERLLLDPCLFPPWLSSTSFFSLLHVVGIVMAFHMRNWVFFGGLGTMSVVVCALVRPIRLINFEKA